MTISDDDKKLFKDNVHVDKLIYHDKHHFKSRKKVLVQSKLDKHFVNPHDLYFQDHLDKEDKMEFFREGLQRQLIQKIKKGKITIEARLDLHGMTRESALQHTKNFIEKCQERDIRLVCIVHGKGYSSEHKPILKNWLDQWMRQQSSILAFYSAPQKEGGNGAVIVLLKTLH
jgi:DNA-nicking Smr family endonuclease